LSCLRYPGHGKHPAPNLDHSAIWAGGARLLVTARPYAYADASWRLDSAFDLREQLEAANHRMGKEHMAWLNLVDESLDRVRLDLRLAVKWHWMTAGQYQHAARQVTEIGKLPGGWKKVARSQLS
jgi:hypothetical protein